MSTITASRRKTTGRRGKSRTITELHNGDQLTQREFHRRYRAYPEDARFELVKGVVYMSSPVRVLHAEHHPEMLLPLLFYKSATQGVAVADNATIILGPDDEVQPDGALRILEECGGRCRVTSEGYLSGGAELIVEVAHSSVALDMHQKKESYEQAGACEYIVLCVAEQELHWFDFRSGGMVLPEKKGVLRSRAFPGLWIDGPALLARDSKRLLKAIELGIASREHAAFVRKLQVARKRHKA